MVSEEGPFSGRPLPPLRVTGDAQRTIGPCSTVFRGWTSEGCDHLQSRVGTLGSCESGNINEGTAEVVGLGACRGERPPFAG